MRNVLTGVIFVACGIDMLVYCSVEGFIFAPKLFAPVGTGLWVEAYGFTYPLVTTVLLGCAALLWIVFMRPESLPQNAAIRQVPLDLNPMQTFRNVSFIYYHQAKRGRSPLLLISISFCFYYITYISFASVVILYGKHVFNWGPDTIGFFDGLDGGIGLAPSTAFVFAMVTFLAVAGPATPYTRTILSNTVLPHEQAQVFAAFSALESLSTLLSPLMIVLYSICARNGIPALPFFVMSSFLVISNLILFYIRWTPALRHNLPDELTYPVMYSSFSIAGKEENEYTSSAHYSAGDGTRSGNESLISS
eukprot:gene5501-772_t